VENPSIVEVRMHCADSGDSHLAQGLAHRASGAESPFPTQSALGVNLHAKCFRERV